MVQASKKSNVSLHKIPLEISNIEVLKKEVSKKKVPDKKLSKEETIEEKATKEETKKKELQKKRNPTTRITFHNPNSEETTTSFLTKVLAERLAEKMRKELGR